MNALELQSAIFNVLSQVVGQYSIRRGSNSTYQNISLAFTDNTLRRYDHSENANDVDRWRVVLEIEDNKIWFGGSVRDDTVIQTILELMNYPIESKEIGYGNNRFTFYGIRTESNDALARALYTVVAPCMYNLVSIHGE